MIDSEVKVVPLAVRVALPVTVRIMAHDVVIEEGRLLHVRSRLPHEAMWWGLMVYAVHFPDVEAHKL